MMMIEFVTKDGNKPRDVIGGGQKVQVMVDSEEMIGDRMDGISLQEDSLELDTNDKGKSE